MAILLLLTRRASSWTERRHAIPPSSRLALTFVLPLAASLLLAAGPSSGQVTTTSDADPPPPGSLRSEVDASISGETIAVQIEDTGRVQRIDLRTALTFDNDVTIDNSDPAFSAINIDAPAANSFFEIEDAIDVILRDIGLTDQATNRDDAINLQGALSTITFDAERAGQLVAVDILGAGTVIKEGSAALELFGVNSFLGGLTILEGDVIGDVLSFGVPTIRLAPDAATRTSRLVYDVSGVQTLGPGTLIMNNSTNGGVVEFAKRGSGSLDISLANIDASIGVRVEAGALNLGPAIFANNLAYTIDAGATVSLSDPLLGPGGTSSSSLSGAGTFTSDLDGLTLMGDLTGFTGTMILRPNLFSSILGSPSTTLIPTAMTSALNFDIVLDDGFGLVLPTPGVAADLTLFDPIGVVLTGNISGTGVFTKDGPGTTQLAGFASHTGGTRVLAGGLVGNTNNLQGDIDLAGGAALTFLQDFDAQFGGVIDTISGTAAVSKLGTGVVTLANAQPFAGSLDVTGGGLYFQAGSGLPNASLAIGGGGLPGSVTLGADFDPAGSPDNTIAIGGPLSIGSDVRVTVSIAGTSNLSTRFASTGAVTIQPGALLSIIPTQGVYTAGLTYDILTGTSVTGDFNIIQTLFFFDILGGVAGNAYRLSLVLNGNTLSGAAVTPNQQVIAGQLDQFLIAPDGGNPGIISYQAALSSATIAEIYPILDSVSPDDLSAATQIHLAAASRTWRGISNRLALQRTGAIGHHNTLRKRQSSRRQRAADRAERRRGGQPLAPSPMASREERTAMLGDRRVGSWVAWIQGSGLLGTLDSSEAKGFDYIATGPTLGADRALSEEVRVGFALAGSYNRYDTDGGSNDGEGGAVEGTVYGAWLGRPVEILLGARYSHAWVESDRLIQVGAESSRAKGEFEGDIFGAYLELTRSFDLPKAIEIAPLVSLAYTHLMWQDFDEDGLNPLRVQVDEQEIDSAMTSVGIRLSTEREMDQGILIRPRMKVLWNREWADTDREVSGSFASNPTTGLGPFSVEGAEFPTDHGEVSVGWEVGFETRANLFLEWEGRFGEDLIENSVSIGGRVSW